MSYGWTWSIDSGMATSCVSQSPALGEQRPDRPVDHAGGQRALLARATLALEERAGDLARGVHALLDVDGEREEVDVAEVARGRGAEDHGVALTDDDGAGGLLGHLAGLEGDLGAGDLDGDRVTASVSYVVFPSWPALRSAAASLASLWYPNAVMVASRAAARRPERPDASRRRRRASAWSPRPPRSPSRTSRWTRCGGRRAAAVGLEALDVQARARAARPQVRVVEPALVGEQRVVQRPERALVARPPRRRARGPGPRVLARRAGKWRKTRRIGAPEALVGQRAARAREVRVDDRPAERRRARARGRPRSGAARRAARWPSSIAAVRSAATLCG